MHRVSHRLQQSLPTPRAPEQEGEDLDPGADGARHLPQGRLGGGPQLGMNADLEQVFSRWGCGGCLMEKGFEESGETRLGPQGTL